MVVITLDHRLITPFLSSVWPFVRLHSERTGIVENFRAARVRWIAARYHHPHTYTHAGDRNRDSD